MKHCDGISEVLAENSGRTEVIDWSHNWRTPDKPKNVSVYHPRCFPTFRADLLNSIDILQSMFVFVDTLH